MERYVKKKSLDPLDTYVPLVLEAQERLAGLGPTIGERPWLSWLWLSWLWLSWAPAEGGITH
jgi:hypothetical protein